MPKSKTPDRIRTNFEAVHVDLDATDLERIEAIDRNLRIFEMSTAIVYNLYADMDGKRDEDRV